MIKSHSRKMRVIIPHLPIGNFAAVSNMVSKMGGEAIIAKKPSDLYLGERIILTGVGAFDTGMRALQEGNWVPSLNEIVEKGKTPILGICLGMQLMCRSSEEGALPGLSWFDADVRRIKVEQKSNLKVPHMGWNTLEIKRPNSLLKISKEQLRFYFVHSYHCVCKNSSDIIATTHYGASIVAAIGNRSLLGVQFHPEKSHKFGMALIKTFIELGNDA